MFMVQEHEEEADDEEEMDAEDAEDEVRTPHLPSRIIEVG